MHAKAGSSCETGAGDLELLLELVLKMARELVIGLPLFHIGCRPGAGARIAAETGSSYLALALALKLMPEPPDAEVGTDVDSSS